MALDPRKALTQYIHDVWQTEQGLPQNAVEALCQTRDGYLWLGTQEGLVRFDGVRFTVFDRRNTPGLHTHLDLCPVRGPRRQPLDRRPRDGLEPLPGWPLHVLHDARRAARRAGARDPRGPRGEPLDRDRGRRVDPLQGRPLRDARRRRRGSRATTSCRSSQDRDGSLWIGTFGGGLSRFKDGRFTSFTTRDGLSDDEVSSLLEDGTGTCGSARSTAG